MLNFSQLTQDQFSRPETLEAVKAEAFDLVDHLMVPESKKLAEQLEDRLKTMPSMSVSAPQIYSQYQKIITYLRLVALMALDNNMVLELIQKNYLDSFDAGINLNERMTGKMYSIPDLVWPEYAEQLAYALKQNTQKIGQRPILIIGETEPKPPTIQNWLSDYDRSLGPDLHTDIQQEEYLSKNPNAKLLPENEKAKLRNVLRFYNNLKPIPAAVIDKALKDAGVYDELAKESPEATAVPSQYTITEPTIIQAPKRYARPDGRDQYLEPIEEKILQKPAPFVPPTPQKEYPQQPAYTRPAPLPPRQPQPTKPVQQIIPPGSPAPLPQTTQQPPQFSRGETTPFFQQPTSHPAAQQPFQQQTLHSTPPAPPRPTQHQPPTTLPAGAGFSERPTQPLSQPQKPFTPPQKPIGQPSPSQQPPTMPTQPRPTFSRPPSSEFPQSPYLEPIDVPELPKTPAPPKPEPEPRLQGNIVDLSNRESNR